MGDGDELGVAEEDGLGVPLGVAEGSDVILGDGFGVLLGVEDGDGLGKHLSREEVVL